ncbi:MAG: serine hydrolase domain-containing protein [Acholeplasmataceae bacterium]
MSDMNVFLEKITTYLEKMDEKKQPLSLAISGDDISFSFQKNETPKPFHIFGITKLFMAYLIDQLHSKGIIDIDGLIHTYIDQETLSNLFVFRDIDYQNHVTIRMLLDHTSGIADFLEGINDKDEQFITQLLNQPNQVYQPMDLIEFTKNKQVALGIPGQRYYYSDTGYVLLGIILEKVTQTSLDHLFKTYITKPLKLNQTVLNHENIDTDAIEDVMYNGIAIKAFKSLAAHWGGSGVISTHNDLLNFIKKTDYGSQSYENMFIKGIHYGQGSMKLRLDQLTFLSRTSTKTPLFGHMSFYGTHLWIEPESGLSISLNYGSNKYYEKSFKIIAYILKTYHQLTKEA